MNYQKLLGIGLVSLGLSSCNPETKIPRPVPEQIIPTETKIIVPETKPEPSINEVLAGEIKKLAEPTNQDRAAFENGGLNPSFWKYLSLYSLSPRRQTQQMPEEMMLMMPEEFHRDVAIVIPERLLQSTEKVNEIKLKKKVIIAFNLIGTGDIESIDEYDKTTHTIEFARLKTVIELIEIKCPETKIEVVATIGDSKNKKFAHELIDILQIKLDLILAQNNISETKLSTGADEMAVQIMASQLPNKIIYTYSTNPNHKNHYDGKKTTSEITETKISQINLTEVTNPNNADLFAYVITPSGVNSENQLEQIAKQITELKIQNPFIESKIGIIDSKNPNGGSINPTLIKKVFEKHNINFGRITFGSWGTGGNVIGMTIAQLKIQNAFLETKSTDRVEMIRASRFQAFAHDMIFLNKSLRPELRQEFINAGINFDPTNPRLNYDLIPKEKSKLVIQILEKYVNKKMLEVFGSDFDSKYFMKGSYSFRRLFEMNWQLCDKKTGQPILRVPIIVQ